MSNLLTILTDPNPLLRKKSKDINIKSLAGKNFKKLRLNMIKTMKEVNAAGLAAPQVGQNIRLAVINTKEGALSLINPKISKRSWAKELGEEGCLSLPGIFGQVKRHKKITCQYFNESGKKITLRAQGLLARVIQHEVDHLDGVLFIDKAKNIKKQNNSLNNL